MKAVIRIKGRVDIPGGIKRTLDRLNIGKKYSCTVIREGGEKEGMLKKVRDYVAYGKIDEKTFKELIKERGEGVGGKDFDVDKVVKGFKEGKKLREVGVKDFFRLHPPRGGIDTKQHYPRGVLGEHKEITKLIKRML